jgi:SNF2 family DNA or RNA helicase
MLKTALQSMLKVFPRSVLLDGGKLQTQGNILDLRLSDGLLRSRVKDSGNFINDIFLDLRTWPQAAARCSCQKLNCPHVAASLLSLALREEADVSCLNLDLTKIAAPTTLNYRSNATFTTSTILADAVDLSLLDDLSWYSSFKKDSVDFFSYRLGFVFDGQEVNIVPVLIDLIYKYKGVDLDKISSNLVIHIPLLNDAEQTLALPFVKLKPFLRMILYYGVNMSSDGLDLKLKDYQLSILQEAEQALQATQKRWQYLGEIRDKLYAALDYTQFAEVVAPEHCLATLRDYQTQGLKWLQFLRTHNFSGILADDMGLGKTLQALAHLQLEKEAGRMQGLSLILAPRSVIWNWFNEAKKFVPQLRVAVYHGDKRAFADLQDCDVVISTYGLVQRDKTQFLSQEFYYLILDEAQYIKNSRTKTAQIMQQLCAKHRLCLTGTPMENHLGELWNLFNFLMPGLLGSHIEFKQHFRMPIENDKNVERNAILMQRIKPFILRRQKSQVLAELPPKTEILHYVELSTKQREAYELIRLAMLDRIRQAILKQGFTSSSIVILDALLKLRQVCCDLRLLKSQEVYTAKNSAKMQALLGIVTTLIAENKSIIIFSQFTSMLDLIAEELKSLNFGYLMLTGKSNNREELVASFQNAEQPIFLVSLKAGGVGLNLTQAHHVILYDPWWNPAVEMQAMDRSHRIGQEHPVFIYKLITKGTLEEAILKLQENKRALIDNIITEGLSDKSWFTQDDIKNFFAPIGKI